MASSSPASASPASFSSSLSSALDAAATASATAIAASVASPGQAAPADLHTLVGEYLWSVLTPLNFTLLVLSLYAIYRTLTPKSNALQLPPPPAPVVFRTFNPRTLLPFNGTASAANPNASIYIGVKGKVFDVTPGRNFYGPGGPYENFAGRDATRGLACQSFDESMLTKDLDGPLDDCKDLGREELENLGGWLERFTEKYLIVGNLVPLSETPPSQ